MSDGGRAFFLGSNRGGEKAEQTEGVNREKPLAFLTSLAVTADAMQSETGGVGGLLTFGWLGHQQRSRAATWVSQGEGEEERGPVISAEI